MSAERVSSPLDSPRLTAPAEEFLAELTDAAYQVALKNNGTFIDLQLELWAALRRVVAQQAPAPRPARKEKCPCPV